MDTIGNFLSSNGGTIGSLLGTGAQLYGQQNAGQAISSAATAGIGQANTTLGNVNALYGAQTNLGNNSMNSLNTMLNGGPGGAPDYSNFMNMPGYGFAVQQGTQAAERQAAAMGNAGNSGTAAMIGNQITGTAMQDYNTYIGQLQGAAGLGAQANQTLSGANMQTAGNIEQLGMNSGLAQAGMYTGMGQTASGLGGGGNFMGSGVGGQGGGLGGLIGSGLNTIGNWLGGSNGSNGSNGGGYSNTGTNANGGYTDAYGNYIAPGSTNYEGGMTMAGNTTGDMNTGYDNSTTDYSQSSGAYGGP